MRMNLRVLAVFVEAEVGEVDKGEEEDEAGEVVVVGRLRVESRAVRWRISGKSRTRPAVQIIIGVNSERKR